jgi:iron-sulfur cluster assembly accessory protein
MATLRLTPRAAAEIRAFFEREGLASVTPLRVSVAGGGCCEPHFGLSLETGPPRRDDEALQDCGLTLLVDPTTAKHLGDSEVDFLDDDLGARFLFRPLTAGGKPNAL